MRQIDTVVNAMQANGLLPQTKRVGDFGEETTAIYLRRKLFDIIYRNWRSGHKEIDLICWDKKTLVFVEVKCRISRACALPERAINVEKRMHLLRAATDFIKQTNFTGPYRFDVVSVVILPWGKQIMHFRDALAWGKTTPKC